MLPFYCLTPDSYLGVYLVINIQVFGMFMVHGLINNSIFVRTAVRVLDLKVCEFCQCTAVTMKYHVIIEDIF